MSQTPSGNDPQSPIERMQDRLDFARKLQGLTNKIHGTDNIAQIMVDLSAEISELFQCERLTLYVYSKERGALVSKVKTGIDAGKDLVLPVSRQSIAGYVAATRSTVRIDDLDDLAELEKIDPELRFFNQVDMITGFKSKQMLAAPLLQGPGKELVGVLQLINQRAGGRFDSVAEDGLEALTATLALAFAQRIKSTALLPKRYEVLAAEGVISAAELELAQRWAQRKNKDLEQVLVDDFRVSLAAMGTAMARQSGLAYQALGAELVSERGTGQEAQSRHRRAAAMAALFAGRQHRHPGDHRARQPAQQAEHEPVLSLQRTRGALHHPHRVPPDA